MPAGMIGRDPEAEKRTERALRQISAGINNLILSGVLVPGPGGGFTINTNVLAASNPVPFFEPGESDDPMVYPGPTGPRGLTGSFGVGIRGEEGEQGERGPPGERGPKSQLRLFTHTADVGNSGTSETDLYSDTLAAGQFATDGDIVDTQYGGTFVSSATATRQVKVYFGGTVIFDSGTLTLSASSAWTVYVSLFRVSASVVRYMVSLTTQGAALSAYTAVGEVTGLTLTNTQILKITGQAAGVGAASNDIVAKISCVEFKAVA